MRLEKFNIYPSISNNKGIKKIDINRLGAIVALVGRNGSGKSRILNLLEEELNNCRASLVVDGTISHLPKSLKNKLVPYINHLDLFVNYIRLPELQKLSTSIQDDEFKKEIQDLQKNNRQTQRALATVPNTTNLLNGWLHITPTFPQIIKNHVRRIKHTEIRSLQPTIQTGPTKTIPFEKLIEAITDEDAYDEFNSIHGTALNYLSKLPHQLAFDKDDTYGNAEQYEQRPSFKRFMALKKFIKIFLGKDLNWEKQKSSYQLTTEGVNSSSKGIWKLNGRVFNYSEFSDGEKTLFAFSLLFFLLDQNPSIRVKECIIIIDEPELHLHPESEVSVVNGIKRIIEDEGQLWIATHSLSILANLKYDEIFMVKENEIHHPDKTIPGKTFIELMGVENHIEKLSHFVTNISNWAYLNFIEECFKNPDAIEFAGSSDPEIEVFKTSLKENPNGRILLDFGAGKGRIYRELTKDKSLALNYHALEPDGENIIKLKELGLTNIYRNYEELPESTFDFIVLCNVLHEIPINEWETSLNKIKKSLKETGFLILIEDTLIPKGEMIGEIGFLVLDEPSLKELFSLTETPKKIIPSEKRYADRILCCAISKTKIQTISKQSIANTIAVLQKNTFEKIKELRNKKITEENKLSLGRKSAFYSQLYINSMMAIDVLSTVSSGKE